MKLWECVENELLSIDDYGYEMMGMSGVKANGIHTDSQLEIANSVRLGRNTERRLTRALRADTLGFVKWHSGARDPLVACDSFFREVCSKYALGKMSGSLDSQMVYKMPGGVISDVHLDIQTTVQFSLPLAWTVAAQPLALWYSPIERTKIIRESLRTMGGGLNQLSQLVHLRTRTVEALPGATYNQFQFVSTSSDGQPSVHGENAMLNLISRPLIYVEGAKTEITSERAGDLFQQTNVAINQAVERHLTRVLPSTSLWHWVQQKRVVNIAQTHLTQPVVLPQLVPFRDVISGPRERVVISSGGSRGLGTEPGGLVGLLTLRERFERETETRYLQSPVGDRLVSHLRATPRAGQAKERSISVMGDRLLPMVTRTLVERAVGETEPAGPAYVPPETFAFTAIRREERAQPPSLNYTFAQPIRPIAPAEQAITRVEEKEVVRLIQKEVGAHMTAGSILQYFTRADYTHIADNVYSSLARRLTLEKERLGL